ncbi:HD domain-containing phosphohydrolase [Chamaesiphon minutus]|uniref:HD-GYP domain-containing protein n=1 Tax=Chamaesiphon minutus (strain ATCC 27169 / PCC 6605) TaxID=1173020 RepID=K9U965_CHAP6|nr:HD domain-containing phosphohydrolase [Chamaesiphon minutus]AFY91350.1 HD-GYP domain-containing protein [Chamaesiphon minutus PCC 6605]
MVKSSSPKFMHGDSSLADLTMTSLDSLTSIAAERQTIEQLLSIGTALSDCLNLTELLDLILSKSREITCSDAGSVYSIDRTHGEPKLIFKAAQNDSRPNISFQSASLPLNLESLAGYVAITGESLNIPDAYALGNNVPYKFDRHFDLEFDYRTVSVLVIPMQNREGETIGVLQLIDRKLKADIQITPENALCVTQPYSNWEQQIIRSLASQAAISIERNHLLESIEELFAGFITASVQVIESRDPSTAGHSERVAKLSVRLSQEVNSVESGILAAIRFNDRQIQEIRYASLLHDFGKISIPEAIVQKGKKLYPHQLTELSHRFNLLRRTWELEFAERKFTYLLNPPLEYRHQTGDNCLHCHHLQQLDLELQAKLDRLQSYWELVNKLNQPDVVLTIEFAEKLDTIVTDLQQLAQYTYRDLDGNLQPLLTPAEIEQLLIPRGSLTAAERSIVESHVSHTYDFLCKIPWTKHLQDVPKIAGSHHEKLDGSGYPRRLTAIDIPIQSQIMTIADIYDALTASDRPYKPRLSLDRTLAILHQEATAGKLESNLLELFEQRQVYSVLSDINPA